MLFGERRSFSVARQLIETNGNRLAQIHGDVVLAGGNVHQPVAVAEVRVRQPALFRAEKQRDPAGCGCQPLANQARAGFKALQRMLQRALADRGGAHDQRAIRDGFGHRCVLFRPREHLGRADGRTRVAKRRRVRVHDAQAGKAEIAHGARGRADVERVARGDKNDAQAIGLRGCSQERLFYATGGGECSLVTRRWTKA